jgi:hypothetical protein
MKLEMNKEDSKSEDIHLELLIENQRPNNRAINFLSRLPRMRNLGTHTAT